MRKLAFCICENKGADQLYSNWAAYQRLCFRYIVRCLIYLNPKSQASSLQPELCRTRSETPKTGFLTTRLNYNTVSARGTLCEKHLFTSSFHVGLVILAFTASILAFRFLQHVITPCNDKSHYHTTALKYV